MLQMCIRDRLWRVKTDIAVAARLLTPFAKIVQQHQTATGLRDVYKRQVESFERQGLVVTKTLGEGLWSRLYAAVRDGEQRQPVTLSLIHI